LAANPQGRLPDAFDRWRELKAAYRLLAEPGITPQAILAVHTARVREECRRGGDYLFVEDTASLDFSSHPAAEDLGPIGDGGGRGLLVHSNLCLQIEGWTEQQDPLGVIDQSAPRRPGPSHACGEGLHASVADRGISQGAQERDGDRAEPTADGPAN
jgi:hypothetical protein